MGCVAFPKSLVQSLERMLRNAAAKLNQCVIRLMVEVFGFICLDMEWILHSMGLMTNCPALLGANGR
jgi:hypothetical protein